MPSPRSLLLTSSRSIRRSSGSQAVDAQQSRVVELRFFAGLSVEETAEALGISRVSEH
jgi:DNA-directed RNA polymerase specialized sigma24 family protein